MQIFFAGASSNDNRFWMMYTFYAETTKLTPAWRPTLMGASSQGTRKKLLRHCGKYGALDSANTVGFYSEQITLSAANGW